MVLSSVSQWGPEWTAFMRFEFMKGMKHDASLLQV